MSKKKTDPKGGNTEALLFISSLKALTLHLICGLGLISAFWVGNHIYSLHLITHPSQTLRLISVFLTPVLILLYSYLRHDRNQCSYVKAVGRGLLALPAGAVVIALGATILGAPVGFDDWHRIFARTKENESTDYMISLPAHGAVIGAWFGAWPMPLDWESPWQEWPICVTYGTIAGYLVGLVASSGCIFFRNHQQHLKEE
ncbi:putative phosphatidylinositol-glycan biosynthesis class F protein-like isoform 2 [Capsicum annuum]|nr:putative phosphatidylinositol-glycan biosynthesis class F protein-like isoform 2 [Capsicum annuum]